MGDWAYYAGFHRSDFGLKCVQGVVPCGGSAIAPLRICEVEGLLAESLSVSSAPSRESRAPRLHAAIWTPSMGCQQRL